MVTCLSKQEVKKTKAILVDDTYFCHARLNPELCNPIRNSAQGIRNAPNELNPESKFY